ncbi:unnamed protein product, partial [Laminaria digitata]
GGKHSRSDGCPAHLRFLSGGTCSVFFANSRLHSFNAKTGKAIDQASTAVLGHLRHTTGFLVKLRSSSSSNSIRSTSIVRLCNMPIVRKIDQSKSAGGPTTNP